MNRQIILTKVSIEISNHHASCQNTIEAEKCFFVQHCKNCKGSWIIHQKLNRKFFIISYLDVRNVDFFLKLFSGCRSWKSDKIIYEYVASLYFQQVILTTNVLWCSWKNIFNSFALLSKIWCEFQLANNKKKKRWIFFSRSCNQDRFNKTWWT